MSDIAHLLTEASVSPRATLPPLSIDPAAPLGSAVEIWTDGGCRPNPGHGGWGAILRDADGRELKISGAVLNTTNNRMEMTAAIRALRRLKGRRPVTLFTDSTYLQTGMSVWMARWQLDGWRNAKGKPAENRDLWEELLAAAAPHKVDWRWTRGHAGNPMNERADALATTAREAALRGR